MTERKDFTDSFLVTINGVQMLLGEFLWYKLQLSVKSHLDWPKLNSHAVGMAAARSYGFEIDFVRKLISGSAAEYYFIIQKFMLKSIF